SPSLRDSVSLFRSASCCAPPRPPLSATLFPYTTLFRSVRARVDAVPGPDPGGRPLRGGRHGPRRHARRDPHRGLLLRPGAAVHRSEEHTSELQSRFDLVCRLLLEKKKPPSIQLTAHLCH